MSSLPPNTLPSLAMSYSHTNQSASLPLSSSTSSASSDYTNSNASISEEEDELDELPPLKPLSHSHHANSTATTSSKPKTVEKPVPKKVQERKEQARARADSLKWSKYEGGGFVELNLGQNDFTRR